MKSILKSSFEFLIHNHMIPFKEKKMTSPNDKSRFHTEIVLFPSTVSLIWSTRLTCTVFYITTLNQVLDHRPLLI